MQEREDNFTQENAEGNEYTYLIREGSEHIERLRSSDGRIRGKRSKDQSAYKEGGDRSCDDKDGFELRFRSHVRKNESDRVTVKAADRLNYR